MRNSRQNKVSPGTARYVVERSTIGIGGGLEESVSNANRVVSINTSGMSEHHPVERAIQNAFACPAPKHGRCGIDIFVVTQFCAWRPPTTNHFCFAVVILIYTNTMNAVTAVLRWKETLLLIMYTIKLQLLPLLPSTAALVYTQHCYYYSGCQVSRCEVLRLLCRT